LIFRVWFPVKKSRIIKVRLDQLLFGRGLASSRNKAQAMIMAGIVKIDGKIAIKSGELFPENVDIEIVKPPHPFVSRGGLKLKKGLQYFGISVGGMVCIDAGASTGGFTHCLLIKGAQKVYAVDVGYGQLHYKLRKDPRVVVLERCNVRYLKKSDVPVLVDIITADLAFISLTLVMERLISFLKPGGYFIPLIKPQFEAERGQAKKGVVRDQVVKKAVIDKILKFADLIGLSFLGVTSSPILGPKGNEEFLACFRKTRDLSGTQ